MKATKRILVVDDDPVVGRSFDRVLIPRGYAVITVASGKEALERLASEDYDAVYTDIRMPGMDGIEVARRIKASRPWMPVLIVTGYGDEKNESAAKEIGVSAFLRKPLEPDTIAETAREAVAASTAAKTPPPIPALERHSAWSDAKLAAKNVGLFFAAPFIALFYVVLGPLVLLSILVSMGLKALMKR